MKRMSSNLPVVLALFGSIFSTVGVLAISSPNPVTASVVSQASDSAQARCKQGNRVLKTESRNVGTFTSINAKGAYEIEVVAQQSPSLAIRTESNILPQIVTEVRGNTLFISTKGCINVRKGLKIRITSRQIRAVSAAGANTIKVSKLNNRTFSIAQSGGTESNLFGRTGQLNIKISGAGDVNALKLYSQRAKVEIAGAGNATVFATEALNVNMSGVGVVEYSGNPETITRNIEGIGYVEEIEP